MSQGKDRNIYRRTDINLRIADVLEHMTDAFIAVDTDFRVTYWNSNAERLIGEGHGLRLGTLLWNCYPEFIEAAAKKIRKAVYEQVAIQHEEYSALLKKWLNIRAYPAAHGLSVFIQDITDRKQAEQQIVQMTYYDGLTGLPNQRLFKERLSQILELTETGEPSVAVMIIDTDRFKRIHDTAGYEYGDRLLIEVTKRLVTCEGDYDTLCRFEGDKFIVLLRKANRMKAEQIAMRMLEAFQHPFIMDQLELTMTPSIGVSFFPLDGQSSDTLIANANLALRKASEIGNHCQFYNADMNSHSLVSMERDLRKAIERRELVIYYQPQVDIRSRAISGVEALLRWNHPKWGMVSPDTFIPLAEASGLIISIGEWVLKTACAQTKEWLDAGLPPMAVSVNLSGKQFTDLNLVGKVKRILEETGLPPSCLALEITESMAMDVEKTISTLEQLKSLGVQISMDDFGKGFSSLHYLKRFPIDTIKIDRSFVKDCMQDENDAVIVKTIIAMARSLQLNVIAEGVESKEQLAFLQENLCDEAQGYFFSKPVPAAEFEQNRSRIEQISKENGMNPERSNQLWLEEQLRIAREDLQMTVRKQQGMTFKFQERDGSFIFTLCDGMLLHRMGLSPMQIVGKNLLDLLPYEHAVYISAYYIRAWKGEPNVTFEGSLNGISYIISLSPVRRGGKVVEVIGTCTDVTELKRVEGELRSAKEQLESFIENTSDAIKIIDLQGRVLRVNAAFETMFGWTADEIAGKFLPIIPERFVNETRSLWTKVGAGEVITSYESQYVRKDGTWLVTSKTLSAIKDPLTGRPTTIVGVMRDISERMRSEAALKESEERYRLIADNMTDLIMVMDEEGMVTYASPSHEHVLGFPIQHFQGRSAFQLIHPDDVTHVSEGFGTMLRERKPIQLDFRFKHRNGAWVFMEANGSPVALENHISVQFVVVARDVTKRKEAEELLIKSEKFALVGHLAAGMAHEIRNPITTLKGFYSLMKTGMVKEQYFSVIDGEFNRLETIISDFLAFAKPQALELKHTDIGELIEDVTMLIESQMLLRNIQIVIERDTELPAIYCDANKIKQVLVNVLNNAMESMPYGGDVHIRVKRQGDHQVQVSIMDHGCGIGKDRLKRIGEPFFSTKEKGMGLGLMICEKIIKEHHGSIGIQSEINQGTTVTIFLPVKAGTFEN